MRLFKGIFYFAKKIRYNKRGLGEETMSIGHSLRHILFLVFFIPFMISCSSSSDGGFLGDKLSSVGCPNGGCANLAASEQGILMTSNVPGSVNHSNPGNARFEFSGDCAPSTYPYNHISVQVYNGCSGISGTPRGDVPVFSVLGADTFPHCERGKFSLGMSTVNLGFGQYTVVASLMAGNNPDRASHTYRNDTAAKFSFCYVRSQ